MSAVLKGVLFHQLVITAFKKGGRIDKMIVTIVAVINRIPQCGIILVYLFVLAELTAYGSYSHNNELAVRACLLALVLKYPALAKPEQTLSPTSANWSKYLYIASVIV